MDHQERETERVAALYRRHGMVPPWSRAWREGQDVTAEPPETWPPVYRDAALGNHGEAVAARYWREHAEAVAERRTDEKPGSAV